MPIIKSEDSPRSLKPFSVRDIEGQAQQLLQRARRAAEQLLREAQGEAETIRQTARGEGFEQGRAEGFAEGIVAGRTAGEAAALNESREKLTTLATALSAMMKQWDDSQTEMETAGLTEVVRLAAGVARRITKRQSQIDPQVLVENVKEALRHVVQASDLKIMLNPTQHQLIAGLLPNLQLTYPNLRHATLIDDENILPGGCRILTSGGEVDATIETQLDRVVNELLPDANVRASEHI